MNKLLALIVALFFGVVVSGLLATHWSGSTDNGISVVKDEGNPPQPGNPKGGDDDDDDDDDDGGSKPKGKGHAE